MQFLTPTVHHHFDSIHSTNTALIDAIADGMHPHTAPCLYTASHQSAGRGQHGRTWVSGADNVFLTLYVPIGQDDFNLHQLSGLLSLAVGYQIAQLKIIENINQVRTKNNLPLIGVKWANDVGFYDDGLGVFKKLAGILIEPVFKKLNDKNTLVGVVIGVGLNVNSSPVITDGLYQATCLKELNDHLTLSAKDLYIPMTNAIFQAVQACNRCTEPMYLQHFVDEFNACHLLTNQDIQIFMQNNMNDIHAQGKCIGIGNQGELLLNDDGDIKPMFAGMAKIKPNTH
ncbi:MAG: biotin--[acetyl-CoA-carboxylase] ligase [Moraxella sp.]|nr:biotin--[acetyl-CoA-carboxylase] ligase [Moraxella sp.]